MDQHSQVSKTSFSASGFASAPSPFGALGISLSTVNNAKSFGSVLLRAKSSDSESSEASRKNINHDHGSIAGVPVLSPSLGFSSMAGASAFVPTAMSNPNKFTGATFGTGFGNALGGGAKLSSFAAPVGDAKLGGEGGTSRLFGAPEKDEEEEQEENSEDEEEKIGETTKDTESNEDNEKFQQQDSKCGVTFLYELISK